MHALKARVENGRLVMNEPTDLPEGTVLELVPANDGGDGFSDLDEDEREALEESIDEGLGDIAAGRTFDTAAVIAEIRSRG